MYIFTRALRPYTEEKLDLVYANMKKDFFHFGSYQKLETKLAAANIRLESVRVPPKFVGLSMAVVKLEQVSNCMLQTVGDHGFA